MAPQAKSRMRAYHQSKEGVRREVSILLRKIVKRALTYAPGILYPVYSRWQKRQMDEFGLTRGIVGISFDNDYRMDNEAAEQLLPLFKNFNMHVTWAVIGLWVKEYPVLHSHLLSDGHELMNHSWSHPDNAELRPGDHRKFDALTDQEIEDEITKVHTFCLERLGYRMRGFRLPHFRKHPSVARVLKKLEYEYTSNHFSLWAPSLGVPYTTGEGWVELPLAGIPRVPQRIFETYRLFRSPDGLYSGESQFFGDFCRMLDFTERNRLVTVVYFDACDIVRLSNPPFEAFLDELAKRNIEVKRLDEVAQQISRRGTT